jgi:hypothetical protein
MPIVSIDRGKIRSLTAPASKLSGFLSGSAGQGDAEI